jgi:hypothetical protein
MTTETRIPAHVAAVTLKQADAFYAGVISSANAFRVINAAARSAWNYYDEIFTDTHRLFESRVDARIDEDVDGWAS